MTCPDSYTTIIRRKQKCRKIVYLVTGVVLLIYGLIDIFSLGTTKTNDGKHYDKLYRSRHILQHVSTNNDIADTSPINNNESAKAVVSIVEDFLNSTNNTNSSLPGGNTQTAIRTTTNGTKCQTPSISEFPSDMFTQEQRRSGAVAVHCFVAIYMCISLATVCDYYFVPSLEVLVHKLNIQPDVAGASLMAIGSSSPELCASIIGVFVTEGDIGIGTILGSAVFNLLFVIGVCGIASSTDLKLNWWPLTRDTIAYGCTVVVLAIIIFDSTVRWQEAVSMLVLYILFLTFMSQNSRVEKKFYLFIGDTKSYQARFEKRSSDETTPLNKSAFLDKESMNLENSDAASEVSESSDLSSTDNEGYPDEPPDNIMEPPKGCLMKIVWIIIFPMKLLFFFTIPDIRRPKCRSFVPLTFIIAIGYIGCLTYTLVWMVTTIGYTIDIPDSVMGLTFIAFGSSVPDALASIIVARQGRGDMAVAQALGSNVFDILLGLGLPWTIKSLMDTKSTIKIQSFGMLISCFVTFVLAIIIMMTFYARKFILSTRMGICMVTAYAIYLTAAVVTELFLYDDYRLPMCPLKGNRS